VSSGSGCQGRSLVPVVGVGPGTSTTDCTPQAEWMRVAIELVWEQGAWRVQSVVEVPGPTPTTGTKDRPWQPEPLDTALDGFQRVGSPPGR
jgi:hypothetical protein